MTSYRMDFTCPACGAEMIPAESTVLAPDHTQHTARCDYCLDVYRVDVVATVIERWPVRKADPDARLERGRAGAAEGASPLESMFRR